eukprot:422242_1
MATNENVKDDKPTTNESEIKSNNSQDEIKSNRDYDMIILMRHSKRIDQHPDMAESFNIKWNEKDQYLRPYDPPICDYILPITKMKEIQSLIPSINITKIVISPYLRCIQTATIIAKYLQIKNFEIDARIGEDINGIKSCIKTANHKQNENPDIKYEIPKNYKDAKYLTLDEIKRIICDLYNDKQEDKKENNDENNLIIEWKHIENPGNEMQTICVEEYRNKLNKQQKLKDKSMIRNDILMISHRGVLFYVAEDLCDDYMIWADECGWYNITHNQFAKIYSPTAVNVCCV